MGSKVSAYSDGCVKASKVNENEDEEKYADDVLNVYVDIDMLNTKVPLVNKIYKVDKEVYKINGERYVGCERNTFDDFRTFKLYAKKIDIRDDSSIDDNTSENLEFHLQIVQDGYIVNSEVFLSNDSYNTLITVIEFYVNCFLCDEVLCNEEISNHITNNNNHQSNLESFPPLEKFGLSVVREKNDHYHCGVCNIVFHRKNSKQHFKGKLHEDNQSIALEKAKDRYRNNYRNKNNDKIIITKENNDSTPPKNDSSVDCVMSIKVGNNILDVKYYSWHMISISKSPKNNTFYCMACKINESIKSLSDHVIDESHDRNLELFKINNLYENHLIRQDDKFSHCATCNTIHYLGGIDNHLRMVHLRREKTIPIIITSPKLENNDNQLKNKDDPSTSNSNIERVSNENTEIKNKNKEIPSTNSNIERVNNKNSEIENKEMSATSIAKVIIENINSDVLKGIMNAKCFVYLFGFKIEVLLLSTNAIFYNQNNFYCALCNVSFYHQHFYIHINNLIHITMFNSAPAIQQFGYNYIRSIQGRPHCGICHMALKPEALVLHLQHHSHVMATNIALGITPKPLQTTSKLKENDSQNIGSNNIINDRANTINDRENIITGRENIVIGKENIINEQTNTINDANESETADAKLKDDAEATHKESNEKIDEILAILNAEIHIDLKKVVSQITLTSYNTMVPLGDGSRYCFVCGESLELEQLKKHISNAAHVKLIKDTKFLEGYGSNLIRQKTVLYHCALCNAILRRSELKRHIDWITHHEERRKNESTKKVQTKKTVRKIVYATQKEVVCGEKEPEIKILWSYSIIDSANKMLNRHKTIKLNDLKITLNWEAWNSIATVGGKCKCIICQETLKEDIDETHNHISTDEHSKKLLLPFLKDYFPALIREVGDGIYNCVICNTEFYDKHNIHQHINGKRHKSKYEALLDHPEENTDDVLIL